MPFNIIRNDISKVSADAIVNTANPDVAVGSGVDSTIYEAAGREKLLAERAKIGPMSPGQAAATPAFALNARYIIHTVGPAWIDGNHGEKEAVTSCYRNSLGIAADLGCETIAFPLISTGTYRFPKDEALKIAVYEISNFLLEHEMNVNLVVYDKESFVVSGKVFDHIQTFIGDEDVRIGRGRTTYREQVRRRKQRNPLLHEAERPILYQSAPVNYYEDADLSFESIGDAVGGKPKTFQEMLFRIIDRKGLKDSDVYKKANLDRRLFSKIRSNAAYTPSKKTVLALAVALELNLDETVDLLMRAGYAFSPCFTFDQIVKYCIENEVFNIYEINTYLFDYDQPLLGA